MSHACVARSRVNHARGRLTLALRRRLYDAQWREALTELTSLASLEAVGGGAPKVKAFGLAACAPC